jgi:hypothetical protein
MAGFLGFFLTFATLSYQYERRKAEQILRTAFENKGGLLSDATAQTGPA